MPKRSDPDEGGSGDGDEDAADPGAWWDEAYGSDDAPWDTGEPQPALVDAVAEWGLAEPVLDSGCGTGTHAVWAAERGATAVGVDVSGVGVERARAKAERRGVDASFRVVNALDLPDDLGPFGTVLDSGLFHAFGPDERSAYADELANAVRPGGRVLLVGFADGAPTDWGPTPFAHDDVRGAFDEGWTVEASRETAFETREASVPGLLAVVERA